MSAIKDVFKGVMNRSARLGWTIGNLDVASHCLSIALKDAENNLKLAPKDLVSREAVESLKQCIKTVDALSDRLEKKAFGEE